MHPSFSPSYLDLAIRLQDRRIADRANARAAAERTGNGREEGPGDIQIHAEGEKVGAEAAWHHAEKADAAQQQEMEAWREGAMLARREAAGECRRLEGAGAGATAWDDEATDARGVAEDSI